MRFFTDFQIDKSGAIAVIFGYFVIAPPVNLFLNAYFPNMFYIKHLSSFIANGIFGLLLAIFLGRISYLMSARQKKLKTKKRIP